MSNLLPIWVKKQKVISLMNDKDVPASAKKKIIPELFELRKNHMDLLTDNDLARCLEQISFDKKFFEDEKFKDALAFVKAKNVTDVNGKKLVSESKGG